LADYIYDIKSVLNNTVDLVFAGQTIEHLWPNELIGFLSEAHRVLKADGLLVLDSPNRRITKLLNWHQPEHTMELSVNEIRELVTLAGFQDITVRGVWLCYDHDEGRLLPLSPDTGSTSIKTVRRVSAAKDCPEDSFLWWLEARKNAARVPDMQQMAILTQSIYAREHSRALKRVWSQVGKFRLNGKTKIIQSVSAISLKGIVVDFLKNCRSAIQNTLALLHSLNSGSVKSGYLRHGPYMPLRPGDYVVCFDIGVRRDDLKKNLDKSLTAARLDVCADTGNLILAQKNLCVADLQKGLNNRSDRSGLGSRFLDLFNVFSKDIQFFHAELGFTIKEVTFGVEFRVYTTGCIPLIVGADIQLNTITS
jgi:hypothetical protein